MSFKPEFKGEIEGYTTNFLKQQHWKIKSTVPWEDAMQTAYVVFLRCKRRFPKSKAYNTPQAFMALYKTAWGNEFIDMANADTEHRHEVQEPLTPILEPIGDLDNDGMLNVMLREAPREVQMVLSLFLNAPTELLAMAIDSWKQRGRYSAGGNKQLNQLLGLDPKLDVLNLVETYFRDEKV